MASKEQKRGNKEMKKPKKEKAPAPIVVPGIAVKGSANPNPIKPPKKN